MANESSKWNYEVLSIDKVPLTQGKVITTRDLRDELNRLGLLGFELAAVKGDWFILKRPGDLRAQP